MPAENYREKSVMSDTNVQHTPYSIAKVLNEKLTEAGLKNVPPQMMYNYAKNGLINGVKGVKKYNQSEVDAFVTKQMDKRTSKVTVEA